MYGQMITLRSATRFSIIKFQVMVSAAFHLYILNLVSLLTQKKTALKWSATLRKKTINLPDGMAEDNIIKMREHYVNEVNHRKADFVKYLNSIGIDDAEDAVSFGVKL